MGDHLAPSGGIEVPASAWGRFATIDGEVKAEDLRAKPSWYHDILTPYDNHALGNARSLGQMPVRMGVQTN